MNEGELLYSVKWYRWYHFWKHSRTLLRIEFHLCSDCPTQSSYKPLYLLAWFKIMLDLIIYIGLGFLHSWEFIWIRLDLHCYHLSYQYVISEHYRVNFSCFFTFLSERKIQNSAWMLCTQVAHTHHSQAPEHLMALPGEMSTQLCSSNMGQHQESRAAQLSNQGVCGMCYFQEHADTETTGSPRASIPPQVTDSLGNAALSEFCLPFNLPSLVQSITSQGLRTGIQGEPKVSSAAWCMMVWSCYVLEKRVYYTT